MKNKRKMAFASIILVFLFIFGYITTLPEWLFPNVYPTYIETIETNWNVTLPMPDHEKILYNTRVNSFHGDGESITELHYENPTTLQAIEKLAESWHRVDETTLKAFPEGVQELIKKRDKSASYFYLEEDGFDYIIFGIKGNKVTIYESYI
ncbi:hypothetical protein [Metabacillus malikii]|uniref:DUF5590 domain-containing protein n=1 Tax=Metabacillus malikii TaxID=1504265 RepID=A0ABT9ZLV0_9BACI|nr:hypothetical protein [Metabacillus malikii]MDQ0233275.1 hypothetical protein [Metabacillus malikii]